MKWRTGTGEARELVALMDHGVQMYLRLDGDSDDPNTWHPIDVVNDHFGGGIDTLTVEFKDATTERIFNPSDPIEVAAIPLEFWDQQSGESSDEPET